MGTALAGQSEVTCRVQEVYRRVSERCILAHTTTVVSASTKVVCRAMQQRGSGMLADYLQSSLWLFAPSRSFPAAFAPFLLSVLSVEL